MSDEDFKEQLETLNEELAATIAGNVNGILKAKDFAAEITIFNAREHGMKSEGSISSEHITNNHAVRKTLLERGIRPESLPPTEDVKKVERRLSSEEKKSLKNHDGLSEPAED
jgi:DNA-damage-inducible protein D